MSAVVMIAIQRLRERRIELDDGLTDTEIDAVQDRLGFAFGPEHRELLEEVLPVGDGWPDWRRDPDADLRRWLGWPVEGIVAHVRSGDFWPASWGARPADATQAERVARGRLALLPSLVPVYGHRYLVADAAYVPSPVFSVYGSDVIVFGDDLLDYVAREHHVPPRHESPHRTYVPFWSDIAMGADDAEL